MRISYQLGYRGPLFVVPYNKSWKTNGQITQFSCTLQGHSILTFSLHIIFLYSLYWDTPIGHDNSVYQTIKLFHIDPIIDEIKWYHPFTLAAKVTSADLHTIRNIQLLSHEVDAWYQAMDHGLEALWMILSIPRFRFNLYWSMSLP